jgi:hypothetical protein
MMTQMNGSGAKSRGSRSRDHSLPGTDAAVPGTIIIVLPILELSVNG